MHAGIIVINLDTRPDRMLAVEVKKAASDLRDVHMRRLSAVDGRKVDYTGLLSKQARIELADLKQTGLRSHHAQLSPGAIGCYLSHFEAWSMLAEVRHVPGTTPFLIVEDDVDLPQNAHAAIQYGWNAVQDVRKADKSDRAKMPYLVLWNIICLEGCHEPEGDTEVYEPDAFWSMMAYSLTPDTARMLVKMAFFPIDVQIDTKLYTMKNALRIFAFPCMGTDRNDTDIQVSIAPEAPYMRETEAGTQRLVVDSAPVLSTAETATPEKPGVARPQKCKSTQDYVAAIVVLAVLLVIAIAIGITMAALKTSSATKAGP